LIGRRTLLRSGGFALVAAPFHARAEGAGTRRIGFLGGASASGYTALLEALILGLRDHGHVVGKNLAIEYRWADGKYDRLPGLAAELVRLKVELIVTQGTPAALAAKRATATIPIVMAIVGNPVESGIVQSYARPGGNITGSSFFWGDLCAKRLELLKLATPRLTRAGALINPDNPATASIVRAMEERAQALKVSLQTLTARSVEELDGTFQLAQKQIEGLTLVEDGLFLANPGPLAELTVKHRVPTIGFEEYVEAGGLLAYGVDFPHIWRQSSVLVDKIFKGAKPADLPIQQATQFRLVVNLKTAKVIGLTLSADVLARADRVIGG
jgi:putative ABC transport system substrate-binding protein